MAKRQQALFETEPAPWELDAQDERLVATVVFPEAPPGEFDYEVTAALAADVEVGRRLRVPLGRSNRALTGYCVEVECRRDDRPLKPVKSVVDTQRLFSSSVLDVARWIASYYLCPLGQVLQSMVPAGVRGFAGTRATVFLSVPTHVGARMTQLKLPAKQSLALRLLWASSKPMTPAELAAAAGCTSAPIDALREKKLVREERSRVDQFEAPEAGVEATTALVLNADQQRGLAMILEALRGGRYQGLLVHGVTGSGKTEVYMQAIDEVIRYGRQAIVLVPEISLTPQTCQRFRSRFPRVAVLHSHLTAADRAGHWRRIARGEIQVVIGARSAVFAPVPRLGLVVLDEEHDASFKQDSVPRYHARDVAEYRARRENAVLLLGSATPSLESWHAAAESRLRLISLPARVADRPLPHVATIDLRAQFQSRGHRGAISRPLYRAMRDALDQGGQVILLLNRRGFSTSIQCPACGFVLRCADCDIALTHHRQRELAVCHYCDYQLPAPALCPECRFEGIRYSGLGTEKLEAEVRARFAGVPCLRMDSDTMQKPGSHEQAFARFRAGEIRVLLGTQMIAKGLDFPEVTLVGVINADTALHLPDFRAAERTFQLVTQVAGRTGRGERGGRVLVQTFTPEHPAIAAAVRHDFLSFAASELPTRRQLGYPPYCALARLIVRGSELRSAEQFAAALGHRLGETLQKFDAPGRVLGPAAAPIARLRGKHRFHLLAFCGEPQALRQWIARATGELKAPDGVQFVVDLDPLDML